MIDIDRLTLTGAYAALRAREMTAVELFQAMHERFIQTEPALRAWVEMDARQAEAQAVAADRLLQAGSSSAPLLGIPIGVKDIFDVEGKPTRCGSDLLRDAPAAAGDADSVRRLRAAGAVVMGKTVTQELAAGVVSAPARNPWDPDRIPGGSSGGSAVAVAAGSALAALGSDTGGSIRIPAAVTGTVGLKPTWGRVPIAGVFPLAPSLDTVGPITLTVADSAVMWQVLSNRAADVAATIAAFQAAPATLDGIRLGVPTSWFGERVQPAVERAYTDAMDQMRQLGAELVEVAWEDAPAAYAAALIIWRAEAASVHHDSLRAHAQRIGPEARSRFEVGSLLPGDAYLQARRARVAVRDSIGTIFRRHRLDAIVAPTTPATAPRVDRLDAPYPDGTVEPVSAALTRFTMPWNATGQPVLSVPCGFDDEHLPIGLSFVGKPDDELALCRVAHIWEQAAGWVDHRAAVDRRWSTTGAMHR